MCIQRESARDKWESQGPGFSSALAGGGGALLHERWGCGDGATASAAYGCGHRSVGGWCGKHKQTMQGALLGIRKECHIARENRKIIHFHIRSFWTVAPPLSLTTWTNSLKSGMSKNQIEDTGANETGLFLSFDRYDKPHWIKDVGDFCLEFSFYAWQFRKPSRVNPHHPPCILFLVASQRVPGTE